MREQIGQKPYLIDEPSESVEDSGVFEIISLDTINPNRLTVQDMVTPPPPSVLGIDEIDDVAIFKQEWERLLKPALLTPVERQVLEERFGLFDRWKTFRELGQEIGKSPSTIRRIEQRARDKVRSTDAFAKMHSDLQTVIEQ